MWILIVAFLAVVASPASAQGDRLLVERSADVNPGVVVALGDSLTSGIPGTPGSYPAVLATLVPSSWEVFNRGIRGNTTVDMLGRFDTDVTPLSPQYVIVLAGINDDLLGQTPEEIEGHLSALYADVVAIGAIPIPVTLPPGGRFALWTPATEATRVAVNAWIRQQPYAYVDASRGMADPVDPEDLASGYDAGDGIHPSPSGQAALAYAVLSEGLGLWAPPPPAPTSVSAPSSSENPSQFGEPITLSATVSNTSASTASLDGGTVTFNEGQATVCTSGPVDSSGNASCSISALPVGSQSITATYAGDANFAESVPSAALTQTVAAPPTAIDGAGAGSPTTSAGGRVPFPVVPGCPSATGTLSGQTLGLVRLGMTRTQALKEFMYSSIRGKPFEDFFCRDPIGVRVGVASPKVLADRSSRERQRLNGRIVWISTSSGYYALDGIRPEDSVDAAAKRLRLEPPFHIGANYWYLAPDGPATAILKVRGGIVEEIGIADKQLTRGRPAQRVFLTSFS